MSRIRGRNTKPEMVVRCLLHREGYRFRLHSLTLPGKPDLVFRKRLKIIFVHGCYWHRHDCRFGRVRAKTNTQFWETKIRGNVRRDRRNIRALKKSGWRVHVVWECETKDIGRLGPRLRRFLGPTKHPARA